MPAEMFEASPCGTERTTHLSDRAIAELADHQHGRVALWQLRELGLSASGVRSRIARGRLHPVRRGVYAVGHRVATPKSHWMAAVLACGRDAALSHQSAGALAEIRRSASALIDVVVPSQAGRKLDGIRVHVGHPIPAEVTVMTGSPARPSPAPCSTSPR